MNKEDIKYFALNEGDEKCKHVNVVSKIQSVKFTMPVVAEIIAICEDCGLAYKYTMNNAPISEDFNFSNGEFEKVIEKFNIKL